MIIFPTPCFSKELFHTRTILSSFPQWWNIMNVSHYVAVVHWANKLTDLMSVLLSFILISWNFLLLLKVWLNMDILSSPPPHPLKEWRWMWRGGKAVYTGRCLYQEVGPGFIDLETWSHLLGLHHFSYYTNLNRPKFESWLLFFDPQADD